jgi:uncharacterized protein YndB with AHSA1/START domain
MTTRTGKTPDQIYKTTIEATAQQVWDALITPEFTRQYWFGSANISKDWKKGSVWEHVGEKGNVHHMGEVIECDPPRLLVLSWHNPGDGDDVSNVRFEITAKGDAVELTVVHGDFIDESPMAARVINGWPKVVANLKALIEESGADMQTSNCGGKAGCA